MNIAQIEEKLQKLMKSFKKEQFIYDFLLAFGLPKASVTRLQQGNLNMSKQPGEVSWKQKIFFKELSNTEDLHDVAEKISGLIRHKQRFIITTNYETLVSIDTKTEEKLDIEIIKLPKHFDFFLPLAGMEKTQYHNENPADVKAAEKMAKLYDAIRKDNPDDSPEFTHGLNVFLSRLLFCFFAEDTGIFEDNQVTNAIASHTQKDGSDLDTYLTQLFDVLDTPENERGEMPSHMASFPYVNGALFRERFEIPKFSRRSRQVIIDSGEMDWSDINPDIFGSMFQAVIAVDQRGSLGQHYTSVPNIMKVIEPLFLNELYEEFEKARGNKAKLAQLLQRLHKIKIFDPACGSGNFLIIAYKELRRLEMKIFKESGVMPLSGIHLSQFYGIELDDFAHEIAQLALWLAEHQMNVESYKEFGQSNPTLPLGDAGQIVQGNACRLNWEEVCPKEKGDEIYILGNPPYLGSSLQSVEQKDDMALVFDGINGYKNLDYIACWFYKGSLFIKNSQSKFSFVSTNSICQGEQVAILWSEILNHKQEIFFAIPSFRWKNNAKSNAAVIVSIIGIRNPSNRQKLIYNGLLRRECGNISPYLIEGRDVIVGKRTRPLSKLPEMQYGTKTVDDGNLTLSRAEKEALVSANPEIESFIKPYTGSYEYINRVDRYCFYINKENLTSAQSIPEIQRRIDAVREFRLKSKKTATRERAEFPYEFGELRYRRSESIIIVPRVSSVRRNYIPFGFLSEDALVSDSAQAIYDVEPWLLGLLSSSIHVIWVKTVGGRLKSDYRYSSVLCYNTFPFPPISNQRKEEITQCVFRILEEREKHSEKTLAELYDPDKMPEGLREAHHQNDLAIERCYRSRPYESDEERLEYLFRLYERMVEEEKNAGTLFAKQRETRKKKINK